MSILRITVDAAVATVVIDRPPVNPLNSEVFQALYEAFTQLNKDEEVRVIILTGAGEKAFVAGADIAEMAAAALPDILQITESSQRAFEAIENSKKPVIAAINGLALGGGFELALACDLRIASEKAKFAFPEVGLGIIPGGGGTQRLQRIVGQGTAKQLLYFGDMIDSHQALQYQIINALTPPEELMQTAIQWAQKLAQKPPIALQLVKSAVHVGADSDLASGLAYESQAFAVSFSTQDSKEGLKAFIEKRKPVFTGK